MSYCNTLNPQKGYPPPKNAKNDYMVNILNKYIL
jgi:hypothetical protein